ncbi:hypothetical protein EN871_20295 [bacterium M00.F.Ca.ET.228.01.1.1]|uniref:hypothetical protein n=1 Tax=Paraburkholderia phenoliruptrix TaxID=252970 RepID=UPI0010920883|nr:hypothetical protein [Paraburkholderia phenoliruptrix]TGP42518.1 hypothetical protein EN871_20295 [bacterium M00.F.Ca.ET.228.01.1.1]TGS00169.1 hypothetical protein EN834_18480 [bacterium M00.F.Ca.ET.191.01.1.1]TGU04490.1 hypothetical protein EN798_19300 [bacterium M00.F.Ca.ET.155.01.1.1]MBW0450521.1 hypothetical protein [Paraburkholderia phenoliruptrix]MBW9098755.1 hypothetical protein [Paraburkholderia phenoliruptrix]
MNIDEMIEDFRLGKLELDCKRIVLTQNKEGGERYVGKGYIKQDTDGVVVYKLYVNEHQNTTPHSQLSNYFSHLGKIHPDETFFNLEAEAKDGTTLRASGFFPNVSWDGHTSEPEFVRGTLQALTAQHRSPQKDYVVELHFFEEYEVPLHKWSTVDGTDGKHHVVDTAEFEACNSRFEVKVRDGSGRSVVQASSEQSFPQNFHWRIQEALQFITGRTANHRALVMCEPGLQALELISPTKVSSRPHFCPPIKHVSLEYRNHGWELFSAFLAYVVASSPVTLWNPLAYHLYNAREASANSIDSWAMGVSVALEAISSLVVLPDDPEKKAKIEQAVNLVKEYISNESGLVDFRDRLNGLVGMLTHPPGPRDKLKWLAAEGKVEKSYIKQWTDLRNTHVHPKIADLQKPDAASIQTQLDRIHSVQVLLCQVTYHLIGFSGPFTDWAEKQYPDKQFPLTLKSVDTSSVA